MQEVYFISGLGANEHAFMNLQLPGIKPIYLKWFQPLQNDTMETYAKRMSELITTKDPIIVGLSLGGMIAVEIAKIIPVKKSFLFRAQKHKKKFRLISGSEEFYQFRNGSLLDGSPVHTDRSYGS
jgi:pimeloyl-ACP methyl ester carboxylesterase